MRQTFLLFLFFVITANQLFGQGREQFTLDSTSFTFSSTDSLVRKNMIIDTSHSDTTNTYLWQVGVTRKNFFVDTVSETGIMTDTLNSYPIGANSWFTIKIPNYTTNHKDGYNPSVSFWHRYQTDSSRDGGIVEFSIDAGTTWNNVLGDCNVDNSGGQFGIFTRGFYGKNDTLITREQAFHGSSKGWEHSDIQFFGVVPVRTTKNDCDLEYYHNDFYLRFRFKSDSIADTLAGWIIKSIDVRYYDIGSAVPAVAKGSQLDVYPNPSGNGIFQFPVLEDERDYKIVVYNLVGQEVLQQRYVHTLDMSAQPPGVYFYKVTDGQRQYSGKLLIE